MSLLTELYSGCSVAEPSTNIYVQKFICRQKHPTDAGEYEIISGVPESGGIFLIFLLYFLQIADILDDFMEGINDIVDETLAPEDLNTHPLSVDNNQNIE